MSLKKKLINRKKEELDWGRIMGQRQTKRKRKAQSIRYHEWEEKAPQCRLPRQHWSEPSDKKYNPGPHVWDLNHDDVKDFRTG